MGRSSRLSSRWRAFEFEEEAGEEGKALGDLDDGSSSHNNEPAPPIGGIVQGQTWRSGAVTDKGAEGPGLPVQWRALWGTTVLSVIGVVGLITAASVATLSGLAANVGTEATALGSIYISRGLGSIVGAMVAGFVYQRVTAPYVIMVVMLLESLSLVWTPFIRQAAFLQVVSFVGGLSASFMDCGCQIIINKVHGKDAGPWLGAQPAAFSVFCTFVPMIQYTAGLRTVYQTMAAICAGVALWCPALHLAQQHLFKPQGPTLVAQGSLQRQQSVGLSGWARHHPKRYKREALFGIVLFCSLGGNDAVVAYMQSYLEKRPVVPPSHAAVMVLAFYIIVTISRVVFAIVEGFINTKSLYYVTFACLAISGVGGAVISQADSLAGLWAGVAIYSAAIAPAAGFAFDLNSRRTRFSEVGTAIPLCGLYLGAAVVPYAVSAVWMAGAGCQTLPVTLIAMAALSMAALFITSVVKNEYSSSTPSPPPARPSVQGQVDSQL